MTTPHVPSVERSIYFYRIHSGVADDGLPLTFDPTPALSAIQAIKTTPQFYVQDSEGSSLCLFPEGQKSSYPRALFCRVRRAGLPQLEQAGQISDLNIAEDQGLLEVVHVVFFPNNVIGAEYNHFGPRLTRLAQYLNAQSDGAWPSVRIGLVLREDPSKQLDNLGNLHSLEINVEPSAVEITEQVHKPLGEALRAMAAISGEPSRIRLAITMTKDSEQGFLGAMVAPLKNIAR